MVCVLLADGFEEAEAIIPVDILRRGGVQVALAGVGGDVISSSHHIRVEADLPLSRVKLDEVDMVFVPGGLAGVNHLLESGEAGDFLRRAAQQDKCLAAICAGPTVLSRLGLIDGKKAVCYPGCEDLLAPALPQPGNRVVRDGKLLTGEAAGSAFELGFLMLEVLRGADAARQAKQAVYYHG